MYKLLADILKGTIDGWPSLCLVHHNCFFLLLVKVIHLYVDLFREISYMENLLEMENEQKQQIERYLNNKKFCICCVVPYVVPFCRLYLITHAFICERDW